MGCSSLYSGLLTSSEIVQVFLPTNLSLTHLMSAPFCPSQDRCNIINTTLGFLTQKVKLENFNTILIGLLMKNSNNLRITGVALPLGKVKVARHSTYGLFLFFFPSLFYSAWSQSFIPYIILALAEWFLQIWVWISHSFTVSLLSYALSR